MVYAAAIPPDPDIPLADYSITAWRETIDTYLTGFLLCFQQALKVMPPGGHILAVSSAVTRLSGAPLPEKIYVGHYAATKAALDQLCIWGRREANQRGILLSRLAPGALDVPFHRTAPPHRRPPAMLPLATVAEKIVYALLDQTELDEFIIANPQ